MPLTWQSPHYSFTTLPVASNYPAFGSGLLVTLKINFSSRGWDAYDLITVKTLQNPSRHFYCAAARTVALSFATAAVVISHLTAAEPPAPRKVASVEGITEYQ